MRRTLTAKILPRMTGEEAANNRRNKQKGIITGVAGIGVGVTAQSNAAENYTHNLRAAEAKARRLTRGF